MENGEWDAENADASRAENADKNGGKKEGEIGVWEMSRVICALFIKTFQKNAGELGSLMVLLFGSWRGREGMGKSFMF